MHFQYFVPWPKWARAFGNRGSGWFNWIPCNILGRLLGGYERAPAASAGLSACTRAPAMQSLVQHFIKWVESVGGEEWLRHCLSLSEEEWVTPEPMEGASVALLEPEEKGYGSSSAGKSAEESAAGAVVSTRGRARVGAPPSCCSPRGGFASSGGPE